MFLTILAASATLLWTDRSEWRTAFLLAALIWSSARFYYFVFYVLERYVDPRLKYSGWLALIQELLRRREHDR